jgi:hypothetical protein
MRRQEDGPFVGCSPADSDGDPFACSVPIRPLACLASRFVRYFERF